LILKKCKSAFENVVVLSSDGLSHILLRHPELRRVRDLEDVLMSTVKAPDFIVKGKHGEHIAVRYIPDFPLRAKFLIVAYNEGGEIRTAFVTSKPHKIKEREVIWSRQLPA